MEHRMGERKKQVEGGMRTKDSKPKVGDREYRAVDRIGNAASGLSEL